eukprot:6481213-Heterocapsa_arctica.AAC.1
MMRGWAVPSRLPGTAHRCKSRWMALAHGPAQRALWKAKWLGMLPASAGQRPSPSWCPTHLQGVL